MARWISGITCAAAALSVTLAAAPSSSAQSTRIASQKALEAAKAQATTPHEATISGCVVRDAANGGQATITSNGISYKLTGKTAASLNQYLGKRVDVTGMLSAGSNATRATSGTSKTDESKVEGATPPTGLTATAGQSDVTTTGVARDNTVPSAEIAAPSTATGTPRQTQPVPLATDSGTTADQTGQMQVKIVKVISPNCL